MRQLIFTTVYLLVLCNSYAQNTGVGTTTPRSKLHVYNGASGNITPFSPMVVESNTSTYINLLSPDASETAVLFGKASNAASGGIVYNNPSTQDGFQFRTNGNVTRMILRSNGDVGIGIGEAIPGATLDVHRGTNGGGTAVFRGTSHVTHFNYSTNEDTYIRAGKDNRFVILNDIPGGKVGIGTSTPNAPLGFPPAVGKKITLYPGATGDVGFGVQGNLLQIYSDNPFADIAFGYDQMDVLTERFRMKANGAFVVNGNAGVTGQVLQTNGGGTSPTWVSPTNTLYNNTVLLVSSSAYTSTNSTPTALPGLSHTFSVSGNAKVLVTFSIYTGTLSCFACGQSGVFIDINVNGGISKRYVEDIANGVTHSFAGSTLLNFGAGTHTISFAGFRFGPDVIFGHLSQVSNVVLQIIPQ